MKNSHKNKPLSPTWQWSAENTKTSSHYYSCELRGQWKSYSVGNMLDFSRVYFWMFSLLPVLPWPQRLPKAFCFICLGNGFAAGRKYKNNTLPLSESANVYRVLLRIRGSPVSQNMSSEPTNATKPVLNFRGGVQMSFQTWVLWRDWPTTGPGTPCTGPAPPRPPSADTPWTRAGRAPLPGRPWSRCQRKTIPTCWPWTSVKSQSRFQDYNI